jgi:hypothetical protein
MKKEVKGELVPAIDTIDIALEKWKKVRLSSVPEGKQRCLVAATDLPLGSVLPINHQQAIFLKLDLELKTQDLSMLQIVPMGCQSCLTLVTLFLYHSFERLYWGNKKTTNRFSARIGRQITSCRRWESELDSV